MANTTEQGCFACGAAVEHDDEVDVDYCTAGCFSESDDEDYESYIEDKQAEHEDWYRGDR